MNEQTKKQKLQKLRELEIETTRLAQRIKEAKSDLELNEYPSSRMWAAVKRASLDLNVVGVKLRKFD